ncbi:MAG: HAD family phosphatase [Saprospiraceae bacterium]|nr:HAD family phosphatase [Saprospiraceae bacterium]
MRGVIFDMDGTMVDNMMVHHRAWQKKLADLGIFLDLDQVKAEIHGVNEEILARMFGDQFTVEERKQISHEKEAAYRSIFKNELVLVSGLTELLSDLSGQGLPLAIGTAAPIENVDFVLDELALRSFFRAILHAGSVTKGKPNPEIFLKAASALNLPIEQCLVFEDSVTGAEASHRAGAQSIIITTTHRPEEFTHLDNILAFIEDFSTISVQQILDIDPKNL